MEDWLEKSLPFLTDFIQDECRNQLSEMNVCICREEFFTHLLFIGDEKSGNYALHERRGNELRCTVSNENATGVCQCHDLRLV